MVLIGYFILRKEIGLQECVMVVVSEELNIIWMRMYISTIVLNKIEKAGNDIQKYFKICAWNAKIVI